MQIENEGKCTSRNRNENWGGGGEGGKNNILKMDIFPMKRVSTKIKT